MYQELKYFSKGAEGIILRIRPEKDQCIKAYYGPNDKKFAEKEWEILNLLYSNGIRVPRPTELCKVTIKPEHIRFRKFMRPGTCGNGWNNIPIEDIIGERFAIKRQFIQGKKLGHFILPRPKIKTSTKELNESIMRLGFIVRDKDQPSNYISTPQGVYMVDVASLFPIKWPWEQGWAKTFSPIVTWLEDRRYALEHAKFMD